jgi:hypothetical protein
MTRIFLTLASLSVILLVAVMVIGLSMGDLYAQPTPSQETLLWASRHRMGGLAAAIGVILVECFGYTYFLGTSRWCKEVVETYQLDSAPVIASNRLKRKTFPWALIGMLTVVGVAALGAASDPATLQPNTKAWANWHLVGAFAGIALIAWTYLVVWTNIMANQAFTNQLVADVSRFRDERGLDRNVGEPPFPTPDRETGQAFKR